MIKTYYFIYDKRATRKEWSLADPSIRRRVFVDHTTTPPTVSTDQQYLAHTLLRQIGIAEVIYREKIFTYNSVTAMYEPVFL